MPVNMTPAQQTLFANICKYFPMDEFSREEYKTKVGLNRVPSSATLKKLVEYGKLIMVGDNYKLVAAGEDLTIDTFAVEDKRTATDSVSMLFKTRSEINEQYNRIMHWINNATYATEPNSQKGIYRIIDTTLNKVIYIGQTGGKGAGKATFDSRWKEHKEALLAGTHHCVKLQAYFNTNLNHDLNKLSFEIQEELPSDPVLIDNRERYWIDYYGLSLLNTLRPALISNTLYNGRVGTDIKNKTLKGLEAITRQTAASIHSYLYSAIKLSDQDKATLIAGIVIALNDNDFLETYTKYTDGTRFVQAFDNAIQFSISQYPGLKTRADNIYATFDFIKHNDNFTKVIIGDVGVEQVDGSIKTESKTFIALQLLTEIIHNTICKIAKDYPEYDVMGDFYNEFAKYSGADQQSLGIVLTPHHIAEFMSDLLDIQPDDTILDICCGTGALPIAAHRYHTNNIIGIEFQARMAALSLANIIMRGYNATIYQGDSYNEELLARIKDQKPTKMIINPPYNQKGYPELGFVQRGLDQLEPGGLGVVIVPMSCAIKNDATTKELKQKLFQNHQLLATFSMPDQLFYPVSAVTIIMLFKAHTPNTNNDTVFFGYMKDDGFEITRTNGRQNVSGKWHAIKEEMLNLYYNHTAQAGKSAIKKVAADDEWCCEAYMKTDYNGITPEMFQKEMRQYILFKLQED